MSLLSEINWYAHPDVIEEISVKQHYEWEYSNSEWSWDLSIPLSLYLHYYELKRPGTFSDYVKLALDPDDDYYLEKLVDGLENVAREAGYNKYETVEYVISFVQSLPYTVDDVETKWDEYPRYPIETLFDRGGDCEDTSILVCALLDEMGYDTALILYEKGEHCAVGVSGGEGIYGTYFLIDDTRYFYLETTGEGWELGEMPDEYKGENAYVYPLKEN